MAKIIDLRTIRQDANVAVALQNYRAAESSYEAVTRSVDFRDPVQAERFRAAITRRNAALSEYVETASGRSGEGIDRTG